MPCPACGCSAPSPAHAVAAALREGDLAGALDAGLLERAPCPSCTPACAMRVAAARAERVAAFAARERHLARQARLARRQQERDARRAAPRAAAPAAGAPPA
ncbi:MAG: hypothetical protein ACTHKZ_04965, partial [Lysobacteraceae bacterium]